MIIIVDPLIHSSVNYRFVRVLELFPAVIGQDAAIQPGQVTSPGTMMMMMI